MGPPDQNYDPKNPVQYSAGPGPDPAAYGKGPSAGCNMVVLGIGLFLAFVIAAVAGFWLMVGRPELDAAGKAGQNFIALLQADKTDLAYQLTTPRFQKEYSADKFGKTVADLEAADATMSSWVPEQYNFLAPHGTAYLTAKSGAQISIFLDLKKIGPDWKIDGLGYSKPSSPPVSKDKGSAGASGEGGATAGGKDKGSAGGNDADLIGRGNDAFARADYDEAVKLYSRLIQLEPDSAAAFYNRANTYYAQNNYKKALADYDRAIELEADQAEYYNNRGNTHLALDQIDAAIADYDQAVKLDPKDALAYYNRGNARHKKNDNEGALADYNAALKADPKYASAYFARANYYYDREDFEKAVADFTQAINLEPDPDYYNNRGNALYSLGKYDRALADYSRALELAPDDADGYFNRANTNVKLNNLAPARADYEKALSLNPEADDVMARYARVLATTANAKFRDPAHALELATRANKLTGWERPYYLDTIAAACAAAGKFDDAMKYQSQALGKLAEDADAGTRAAYQSRLELYRQKKPFVEDLRGK